MMPPRKKRPVRKTSGQRKAVHNARAIRNAISSARKAKAKQKLAYDNPMIPWNLDAGTTFSMLNLFQECREQTFQSYVNGYSGKKLKDGLEFGSIWHLMQEHYYKNTKQSPTVTAAKVCKAYEKWRDPTLFKNEHENFQILLGIAEMMFPLCVKYWAEDDDEIDWIEQEQKFKTSYTFKDIDGRDRTIFLRGMRDGVFREDGVLGVFETKTKGQINQTSIRDQLKADLQTLIYVTTSMIEFGEMPGKVMYNVVRRPQLKRKQNEALSAFLKRIQADVIKRPKFYFMRWNVDLTKSDIANFRRYTLDPLLGIFCQWADGLKKIGALEGKPERRFNTPFHFLNCTALVGRYGRVDMFDLLTKKNTTGYLQRKSCFPELDESNQAL
jgi:hypothetical protein